MIDLEFAGRRSLLQAAAAGCATLACGAAAAATTSVAKAGELYVIAELNAKPGSPQQDVRRLRAPVA